MISGLNYARGYYIVVHVQEGQTDWSTHIMCKVGVGNV